MDLHCEIVTPEKQIYNGTVGLVTVPGDMGQFTILKNHAPIITTLGAGKIRVIAKSGHEDFFKCKSGIAECKDNKLVILIHS